MNLGSEKENRAAKVRQMVSAIAVDAIAHGKDWKSAAFAEELAQAGQDFWRKVAAAAGCTPPSPTTQAAVIEFFRRCATPAVVH